MNSCILMVKIVENPQLRTTQDEKTVADMWVEFENGKPEEPPARIRVVGWGNTAAEIQANYQTGDRAIVVGRLKMNVFEREGTKEKRAELIASRLHKLDGTIPATITTATTATSASPSVSSRPNNVVNLDTKKKSPEPDYLDYEEADSGMNPSTPVSEPALSQAKIAPTPVPDEDLDEIPF
ncbi:MAG: single-stranded DNA-binding protein [Oscillatoria sp. PMC 1051.18]|nr:single-stranded DNA-binding protein [Oscillatoria sp. PMC 1050.18]MEC5029048.1 single-stranded DNA-binding protein [Oscillatoria sp. PMC 1051.18]